MQVRMIHAASRSIWGSGLSLLARLLRRCPLHLLDYYRDRSYRDSRIIKCYLDLRANAGRCSRLTFGIKFKPLNLAGSSCCFHMAMQFHCVFIHMYIVHIYPSICAYLYPSYAIHTIHAVLTFRIKRDGAKRTKQSIHTYYSQSYCLTVIKAAWPRRARCDVTHRSRH